MLLAAASQFGISLADIDHPAGAVQTGIRFIGFVAYPWHVVFMFLMACALASRPARTMTIATTATVMMAALYTAASAPRLLSLLDPNVVATIGDVSAGWQGLIGRVVLISALAGTMLLLAVGYRQAGTVTQGRRMGWLLAGIVPAAAAYLLSTALSVAARSQPALSSWYERVLIVMLFTSLSVPIAFAYALARHELFGVRVVVRRSIQYALAKSALLWLLAVPVIGLAWTVWRNPDVTVRGLLSAGTPNVYLLLAIAFSLLTRERLLAMIDRRFFRDVRDRERILVELASNIGRIESANEAVTLAEQALEASLHPTSVRVWLRDDGEPLPEGFFDSDTVSLDDTGELLAADRADAPSLLAAALTVPIVDHGGELIGALLLGSKRSEEPYSGKDRSLLRAIARQIAMVVENANLRREVGQERRIRHEVLDRLDRSAVNVMLECPQCGTCFDRGVSQCPDDGAELIPTLPIERTIAGKYRLERLIGRGGMGAVYDASDIGIGRRVAVKVLRAHVLGSENSRRRFHREARILGGLSHPAIVSVHDYGTLASGGAFLVMERVSGMTWRALLKQRGTIPPQELAVWVSQLCDALIAAHARGVVHRDLKPENVIIQQIDGETLLKVLDFGLAKQLDDGDTDGLSAAGAVLGTLGYMAPEQLAGRAVDHRADVFAVGVMAWEALCGEKPYNGISAADLAIAMHQTPPEPPSHLADGVRAILRRAIAYDAGRRPMTVLEMRQELVPALLAR
jgi:GAF domain-containing protein/tRNA A-37 threonylcarbamoyl transferase component Bud32